MVNRILQVHEPERIIERRESKRLWNAKERKLFPDRVRARSQRYKTKNADTVRRISAESLRRYRIKNPLGYLFRNVRGRAKKKGLDFNIEIEDLILPVDCPVLNIKLDFFGKDIGAYPSFDRIDNSKGYIKGNVRIISNRANRYKCDMSVEDCKLILKDLENCQNI